jgi:hypothetical protein
MRTLWESVFVSTGFSVLALSAVQWTEQEIVTLAIIGAFFIVNIAFRQDPNRTIALLGTGELVVLGVGASSLLHGLILQFFLIAALFRGMGILSTLHEFGYLALFLGAVGAFLFLLKPIGAVMIPLVILAMILISGYAILQVSEWLMDRNLNGGVS